MKLSEIRDILSFSVESLKSELIKTENTESVAAQRWGLE